MCGRTACALDPQVICKTVGIAKEKWDNVADYRPSHNISPGMSLPVYYCANGDGISMASMKWGLEPEWAKDKKDFPRPINARCDGVHEKPMFCKLLQRGRCVVICQGYYEWKKVAKEKCPYYLYKPEQELLLLAGLYESYIDASGKNVKTFAIMTTEASQQIEFIHDRMPCILSKTLADDWVNNRLPAETAISVLSSVKEPLAFRSVSSLVNSARNDGPNLIEAAILSTKPSSISCQNAGQPKRSIHSFFTTKAESTSAELKHSRHDKEEDTTCKKTKIEQVDPHPKDLISKS
eukprot:TRINITY_DN8871_c0_g1_i1.p1 TRINITY_DN8871_c0_g1~~TRINITY_DN8871_c0_g1_i1.p1  ORF type:complete len:293 (+),score=45.11 TRINITY_DN8871_c0_g1_i1:48-926(+)